MQEQDNHSVGNKKQVKKSLALVSACGIVSAFLTLTLSLLARALGLYSTFQGLALADSVITALAVLLPAVCFSLPLGGVRRFFSDKKRLSPFDSIMLFVFGLGGCVTLNFLVSLLSSMLPFLGESTAIRVGFDPANILLLTGSMAAVPAICEEIAYRGFVFGSLRRYGVLYAAMISSVVFGMLHSSLSSALFAFFSGMLFAFLRQSSGRLIVPLTVHFLNNTVALLGSASANTFDEQTYQRLYLTFLLVSVFMMLAAFAVLYARGIRFSGRHKTMQLTARQKLRYTFSCPVFVSFLAVTLILKFL